MLAALVAAHAAAAAHVRATDGTAPPSSLDVLACLRRAGYVACKGDVIEWCRDALLPLADMPHDVARARRVR
jgi:hypothetical protein